jgi:hypothetical protein
MRALEILAERRIREAMDDGFFDDLPGKGRPLDLSENPFEDPDCRMAHRLLRNSGHTLPWIEESRDIVQAIERARAAFRVAPRDPATVALFRVRVAEINRRVLDFNVRAPVRGVQLLTVEPDIEIERAIAASNAPPARVRTPPRPEPLLVRIHAWFARFVSGS